MNNLNLFISRPEILEQDSAKSTVESPETTEVSQRTDSKELNIQMNKKIQSLLTTLTKDPISDKNLDFDKEEDRKLISQALDKLSPEDKQKEAYKELTNYITEFDTYQEVAKKALDSLQTENNKSLDNLKQQIINTPKIEEDKNKVSGAPKVENQSETTEQHSEALPFETLKNTVSEATKEQVVTKLNQFLAEELKDNPKARIPGKSVARGTENEGSLWIQKAINMVNGEDILSIDGKFGNKSYKAVKDFQTTHNLLKKDGLADKETVNALIQNLSVIAPAANTNPINQANVIPATNKEVETSSNITHPVESTRVEVKLAGKEPSLKEIKDGATALTAYQRRTTND